MHIQIPVGTPITDGAGGDSAAAAESIIFNKAILRQGPEFIRNRTNTAEEHTAVYNTVQTSTTHGASINRSIHDSSIILKAEFFVFI